MRLPVSPDLHLSPAVRRLRLGALTLAAALGVAACSSVALGPVLPGRSTPIASPPPPPPLPSTPTPAPPVAPAPAQAMPVPSSNLPAPVALPEAAGSAAAPEAAPPYGPAVAARFPDPVGVYATPAFAPGHAGFTSNVELHAALMALVGANAQRLGDTRVELLALGSSQDGVPLEALRFYRGSADDAQRDPERPTDRAGRPTVLLIGQQHGDEPAGSEALLAIAQELAGGRFEPLLDRIEVIVLPRANPDGAAAGRRATANGIDANRDHLLLKTPEAQALAQLVREYTPVVVVDAHEYTVVGRYLQKFGSVQRFDALMQYAMTANLSAFIAKASEEWFREPVLERLKEQGLTSEWYYTTSTDTADKKISMGGTQPDTGRNVFGLTNAVSILIETRGVGLGRLHLKRRVHTHVVAIGSILHSAATRAADLVKLRQFVDHEVSARACQGEVVVEAGPTPSEYRLLMLDPQTGADKAVVVAWDSALELRALRVRPRPCGYWLAEQEADAVQHLRALGVRVQRLEQAGEVRGEIYRETSREVGARQDVRGALFDGSAGVLRVRVQTVPALLDLKAGGYYVPLDQPLANLAVAALEPDTQNSFHANRILTSSAAIARVLLRPEMKTSAVR